MTCINLVQEFLSPANIDISTKNQKTPLLIEDKDLLLRGKKKSLFAPFLRKNREEIRAGIELGQGTFSREITGNPSVS